MLEIADFKPSEYVFVPSLAVVMSSAENSKFMFATVFAELERSASVPFISVLNVDFVDSYDATRPE